MYSWLYSARLSIVLCMCRAHLTDGSEDSAHTHIQYIQNIKPSCCTVIRWAGHYSEVSAGARLSLSSVSLLGRGQRLSKKMRRTCYNRF